MPKIIIEKNPSEERLKELGVSAWETWDCPVTEFRLDFDETEKAYILE
ncbi:MAG TPA: cupin, partial [Methylophaga sp.]|nr:cupin [Methylophaga sp.]